MNNLLDKLFRNKLADHSIAPEVTAWARISAGLPKKNKKIIWYRAAAALLIGGLAFTLWYNTTKTISTETLAKNEAENKSEKEPIVSPEIKEQEQPIAQVTKSPEPEIKTTKKEKVKRTKTKTPDTNVILNLETETSNSVAATDEVSIDDITTDEREQLTKPNAPIVIVYELKEIHPKNEKAEGVIDLEPFPSRKNGFKKVLEVANEVRTGESPLGGLRQAKEEILAFNFKKEDKNNK